MTAKIKKLSQKLLDICQKLTWLPPLIARVTLGAVFIESGWGKIHNLEKVINFFTELGIPFPELQAPFVAWSEFICGTAIMLGLCTRLACLPLVPMMIVAILTARKEELNGVTDLFGFIEYLYIVLAGWLVINGPGPISIDRILKKKLT